MSATIIEIEHNKSKIPIIYEKTPDLPIVTMQLIFTGAGSLFNPEGKEGLVDMLARLLNEGTKKKGATKFADELEMHAIEISAHAGKETFVIELSALKEKFAIALEKLKELLSDPNFTQEAFLLVKQKKLAWLDRKESDYRFLSARALRKVLFEGQPLAKSYEGTKKSIEKIALSDIERFFTQKIGYNNLIVAIGGKLEEKEAKESITSIIQHLSAAKGVAFSHFEASDKQKRTVLYKATQQAYISFGAPLFIRYNDKERYKARVASHILGSGGFGSRLMEEVRVKRGLAYSVFSDFRFTKMTSYLSGALQTKLESQEEAIALVKEVIERFVKEGASKEELEEAKKFLIGSEPLRVETLAQRLNRAFGEYYYERGLGSSKSDLDKIEKLTLKELNDFIAAHPEITRLSFSVVTKEQTRQ